MARVASICALLALLGASWVVGIQARAFSNPSRVKGHKAFVRRHLATGQALGFAQQAIANNNIHSGESQMGDFMCDSLMAVMTNMLYNVSGCLVNAASIGAGIPQGPITNQTFEASFPYATEDSLVIVNVTGQDLLHAIENGLSAVGNPENWRRFPQVGGLLRYVFNSSQDAGSRLKLGYSGYYAPGNVILLDLINPCAVYPIVTLDWIADGGDGYTMFQNSSKLYLNTTVDTALRTRLSWSLKDENPTPIAVKEDSRIVDCANVAPGGFCFPTMFPLEKNCTAPRSPPPSQTAPATSPPPPPPPSPESKAGKSGKKPT